MSAMLPKPPKQWEGWFVEANMPNYTLDAAGRRIVVHRAEPIDFEITLPPNDVANGWRIVWKP